MKKNASLILVLSIFMANQWAMTVSARVTKPASHEAGTLTTTLESRLGHKLKGYGGSAFNFTHGLRSDSDLWLPVTGNSAELLYGSFDSDGFNVYGAQEEGGNLSKIKDLGELNWSDIQSIPELPAMPPTTEGIRGPRSNADNAEIEATTENRQTKAIAGHLYLVHIKNRETNIYAMFRIDALVPGDKCTLSWKLVPSPEKS